MKTNKNFSIEKDFVGDGRMTVISFRTGKKYYIEPIVTANTPTWGDVNPATGKIEGSYGQKNKGGSKEKESLITKENGFKNITYSGVGCSPFDVVEKLDAKYPTVVN
jgi:hypothetical protein